eukprot:1143473-Pelagomonas_calceolata.AAC.1
MSKQAREDVEANGFQQLCKSSLAPASDKNGIGGQQHSLEFPYQRFQKAGPPPDKTPNACEKLKQSALLTCSTEQERARISLGRVWHAHQHAAKCGTLMSLHAIRSL